jgi:peptidoglycan/LPS O-acetylase OafA/YrhL
MICVITTVLATLAVMLLAAAVAWHFISKSMDEDRLE